MFGLFSLGYDWYFCFTAVELDKFTFLAQNCWKMATSQDIWIRVVFIGWISVIFYKSKLFCPIFGFPYCVVALPSGCYRNGGIWTNRNAWHGGCMPNIWSSDNFFVWIGEFKLQAGCGNVCVTRWVDLDIRCGRLGLCLQVSQKLLWLWRDPWMSSAFTDNFEAPSFSPPP